LRLDFKGEAHALALPGWQEFSCSDRYYGCAVPLCARLGAALLLAQFGAGPMSIGQKS